MKNSKLYIVARPIVTFLFKIFIRPTIIGSEKIPKEGRIVLAGNHTHILDCALLMSSTKRAIHYLAKIELFKGIKKVIFANMGLIPVDRKNKNPEALNLAIKYLEDNHVIGIFPEGTINRTDDTVMPFKMGAVKMAKEAASLIIPFVITGKYKLFSRDLKVEFLDPIKVTNNLEASNNKLRNSIKNKLEG